ncbi:MAG: ABC transporter substrate-binding protein [Roseateles sp.]
MRRRAATQLLMSLTLPTLLAGCGRETGPLRIGYLGGLTGRVADLGESGRNGVMLAVEALNAEGGVLGRQVLVEYADDGQDPVKAKAAVQDLLQKKVLLLIGPMTSAMAQAVLPEIEGARLPTVSPTATATSLAGLDDMLFRVAPSVKSYSDQIARADYQAGARRVAIVLDLGNRAFSQDWALQYGEALRRLGAEIVSEQSFTSGDDASYSRAIEALPPQGIDTLMLVASAVDTVRLIQTARNRGLAPRFSASSWAGTEALIQLGGKVVEGMFIAQLFDRDSSNPEYLRFAARYRERFNQEPGFASLGAYDATRAALDALARSSGQGGEALKKALLQGGPYAGLQERWQFDSKGDTLRSVRIAEVRDGRFKVRN